MLIFSGALCGGNTGTLRHFEGTEGGNITVQCSFQFVEISTKYFCRDECEREDIVVQTLRSEAQNGRYSLKYDRNSQLLHVSITQLMKSDAGRYSCGVRRPLLPDSYKEFEIDVVAGEFLLKVMKRFLHVCGGLKKLLLH